MYTDWGDPIDLHGKEHIHPYLTTLCQFNCHYCQNLFYVKKHLNIKERAPEVWAGLLNRMHNFDHIDIQGGEPTNYWHGEGLFRLLNKLYDHNIVVFTNNPHHNVEKWKWITKNNKNNFLIYVTYHHIEEERTGRSIHQFIRDFQSIPQWLHPVCSTVVAPEVSYKNIRAYFAAKGVYLVGSECIVPTERNKVIDRNKTVMCRNSMVCISPDLKVYMCPGLMFNDIGGVSADEYDWRNIQKQCDHFGLCGPITTGKDFAERDEIVL